MRKRGKIFGAAASVLLVLGAITFISAESPDFKLGRNLQIMFNLFRELNMLYVDPVDSDKMLANAAEGMVKDLDPYTEFIPENEMDDFATLTTGKYGGIGSVIRAKGDNIIFSQPYKNSPADKAGIVIGDKILSIDGVAVSSSDVTKVSGMLKGEPGTTVKVKIERLLDNRQVELLIKRERIVIPGIPYYGMLEDGVGIVVHDNFTDDCSSDMKNAFMDLKKQGAKALIIDLRGNGGGILQEAVKILSMFVPKGTEVVSMRGKLKEMDAVFKTQQEPIDTQIPVAVLINSGSASASEIVAGAFQDLDRGVIVGARSYGKGLVQTPRPLGFNSFVKLTTAKYYIPSGRCIQAIDYAHRNEDGSVGFVPDSLIKEYHTAAGRKIYDGGGIMPDIKLPSRYISAFAINIYARGYIEDFANEYYKRNPSMSIDPDTFTISDKDYADFVKFMQDKDIEFESETSAALESLRKKAQKERYVGRIMAELDQISEKIKEDKDTDLKLFKDDLVELINDQIVLRTHYSAGIIRRKVLSDKEVKEAVKVLTDRDEYKRILSSADTQRK